MGICHIITGDDEFAVKERARALVRELGGESFEDDPGFEVIPGDSVELRPEEAAGRFLEALRTPPFLCGSKLVWLRHWADFEPFGAKEPLPVYTEILEFLRQPLPEELTVVIDGFNFDGRKAWTKALKAAGVRVEVFAKAKSNDRNYADNRRLGIREICRELGKTIEPAAAGFLTETIGGDSGLLHNELEKICCYVGDAPEIRLEDCRAVVSRTPETVSWEFSGAIVARDVPRALHLLSVLLSQGEPEIRLMAALSSEFQKQIQTRLAMRQLNLTRVSAHTFDALDPKLREEFPENFLLKLHPYRAYKICEAAAGFSERELVGNLELVRNASRALVSGAGEPRIVLEQLVLSLTARR